MLIGLYVKYYFILKIVLDKKKPFYFYKDYYYILIQN